MALEFPTVTRVWRRAGCLLHGHEMWLLTEQRRMALRCMSCGYETVGWRIGEAPDVMVDPARAATRLPHQVPSERHHAA